MPQRFPHCQNRRPVPPQNGKTPQTPTPPLPPPRVINNSSTASPSSWLQFNCGVGYFQNIAKRRICYKHCVASEVNFQKKYSPLYTSLPRVKQVSKRLICVVAREDLPKQVEESNMKTPKEIFLKEYKMPDYYFDNPQPLKAPRKGLGLNQGRVNPPNPQLQFLLCER
ncbi:uncharacterized protein LOC106761104 isoform X2 [Vigna radiata var. radiata]|uniref:Uncharacterized protein LOC106761104 isoform X2 n=1 Tax=Vigna radiata var. radiata TaxID=3916 RepID=A0A3Q0F400_VIGRR|nr:uncharacterized protein LOC106761104 isoform X2 [Vigna radiata var. radiata]